MMTGQPAPTFDAPAVLGDGTIVDSFDFAERTKDRYALVFFYPLDFTFVCPSELIALDRRMAEFKERNVEVMAVSIDSQFTHHAWRNTAVNDGGIGPVGFTMVADVKHEICRAYGVESPGGVAYRGAFVIDGEGTVRASIVHDLPLGRNVDELLRVVDALQFHEKHGDVCPAGWNPGDSGMKASPEGVASYLSENAEQL
ncbi:MAG: peroxiredoxin [Acidobacteriota bacterium]